MKAETRCPCCGQDVVVEIRPAKWQEKEVKVTITHKKWQPGYTG